MISRLALARRTASVMVNFGIRGYTPRVAVRPLPNAWAHCDFNKRELVFSPALLETDWVFANQIILHEAAHALAGPMANHGRKWKDTARSMGYRLGASVPYSDPQTMPHEWAVTCQTGEHSAMRHAKTFEDGEKMCGKCNDIGAGLVPLFWERL